MAQFFRSGFISLNDLYPSATFNIHRRLPLNEYPFHLVDGSWIAHSFLLNQLVHANHEHCRWPVRHIPLNNVHWLFYQTDVKCQIICNDTINASTQNSDMYTVMLLVDWQRGQFECFGFDSNLNSIINPSIVYIFIFSYRYNYLIPKESIASLTRKVGANTAGEGVRFHNQRNWN